MVCIVMGVSGSGKSTIGEMLADRMNWPFYDGDDFHPDSNVKKMEQGFPLSDEDRKPWLNSIHACIRQILDKQKHAVFASSALKESYRNILQDDLDDICWIYLKGDYDLIYNRMQERRGHFMKPEMLRSQFEALEEPDNAIIIPISNEPEEIVEQIVEYLRKKMGRIKNI